MTIYNRIHLRNQLLIACDFSTKIVGISGQTVLKRYLYIDDFWDFKEIFERILLMMSLYIT